MSAKPAGSVTERASPGPEASVGTGPMAQEWGRPWEPATGLPVTPGGCGGCFAPCLPFGI